MGKLGWWHHRLVARMIFQKGETIRFRLTGNREGFSMNGRVGSMDRGIIFKSHNERGRLKKLKLNEGVPSLYSFYRKYFLFVIPYGKRQLRMNPLVNFRDEIPTHYLPATGRRFKPSEIRQLEIDRSDLSEIPLLGAAVGSRRFPRILPYETLMKFMRVWMRTWSEKKPPKTTKEKIGYDVGRLFAASLGGSKATIDVSFDKLRFPGFLARMGKTNRARIAFTAANLLEPPYKIGITSRIDADRVFVRGLLDMRKLTADMSSKITIDRNGFALRIGITGIDAKLNPFRYGRGNPGEQPVVTFLGGRIWDGIGTTGFPSGFVLTKDAAGRVETTFNAAVRGKLRTKHGDFEVAFDLRLNLNGRWRPGLLPKVRPGNNTVEIRNLRIRRPGHTKPLLARAGILISDRGADKKTLKEHHDDFSTASSGFVVQLEADDINVGDMRKGYIASYIHVPLDRTNSYYDPGRFSIQRMVDLAFGLAMKDDRVIKGRFQVKRIAEMVLGRKTFRGRGIAITGNVVSISGTRTRALLRNGAMRILKMGDQWFAAVNADAIGLPHVRIDKPSISADFSLIRNGQVSGIKVNRLRAFLPYIGSPYFSLRGGEFLLRGGRIAYDRNGAYRLGMKRLFARMQWMRSRKLWIGSRALPVRSWVSMSGRFGYDSRKKVLRIRRFGAQFDLRSLSPRTLYLTKRGAFRSAGSLSLLSRGRVRAVDFNGYISSSNGTLDIARKRWRGWLAYRGNDKTGSLHFIDMHGRRVASKKLGKTIPALNDTKVLIWRIDGVDRRGNLKGLVCARTDFDGLAFRDFGIRHADYVEVTAALSRIPLRVRRSMRQIRRTLGRASQYRSRSNRFGHCKALLDKMK